ncbi:MAG: hypothetical protein QMD50_02300 [Patescibacteria group bacterium]|nr:hypothetical protein [Patescibacteria group bacterium]
MPKTQKIIAIFLSISIITAGFFFPFKTKEVKADMAGDFMDKCVTDAIFDLAESIGLGSVFSAIEDFLSPTKVPSSDTAAKTEMRRFELKECLRRLKDLAIVTARNVLKKRLLDQLVDQTINWIQNGGEPRFVTDFQGFLEDAKQAAIGDTLRDIGLGKLCDTRAFAKIELTLGKRTPQKFSQDVTCTLDQVVGNIKAFREDFKQGGWLGIQEAANPRNNIFGLKLMAMDRVIKEIDAREEAAKLEVGSTGYIGQKNCEEYELLDKSTGSRLEQGKMHPIGPGGTNMLVGLNPTPANADGTPPNLYDAAINSGRAYWHCFKNKIITPADTTAAIMAKTGGLDYDYILQSEDVSAYITAISDALINRLSTETGKGLSGLFKGGGSPGRGETPISRDSLYITTDIQNASSSYGGAVNEDYIYDPATINASKTSMLNALAQATSSLENAKKTLSTANLNVSTMNSNLICILDKAATGGTAPCDKRGLIQCINYSSSLLVVGGPYESAVPIGPNVATTLSTAQTRSTTITSLVTQTNSLLTQANTLKTRINAASTSADLNALLNDIKSYSSSAQNLETQTNTLLAEVTSLFTEAKKQRDECNSLYP